MNEEPPARRAIEYNLVCGSDQNDVSLRQKSVERLKVGPLFLTSCDQLIADQVLQLGLWMTGDD